MPDGKTLCDGMERAHLILCQRSCASGPSPGVGRAAPQAL